MGDSSDGRSRKALPLVTESIFSSLEIAGKVARRRSSGGAPWLGSCCLRGSQEPWGEPPLSWASHVLGMAKGLRIAPEQASLEQAFKVMVVILDG